MLTTNMLHRLALLTVFTFSTALAACAASADDVDEEEALDSETSELIGSGIVPQTSIRGIKLGMTSTQVRGILGTPEYINRYGVGERIQTYGYPETDTEVSFGKESQRVRSIRTWGDAYRTKEGVGIGSSRKAVDALPGSSCFASRFEDFDGDSEIVGFIQRCEISSGTTAKTQFYFPITRTPTKEPNAKVVQVTLEKR